MAASPGPVMGKCLLCLGTGAVKALNVSVLLPCSSLPKQAAVGCLGGELTESRAPYQRGGVRRDVSSHRGR